MSFCERHALIAQLVERILGKDEVTGSTPVKSSIFERCLSLFLGLIIFFLLGKLHGFSDYLMVIIIHQLCV